MLCETHKCLHVRAQMRPHTLPLKGSLPLQPVLHSLSKLLQHAGQMNVSHFLFTSDLPLSPCKPEEGDWKRRGEPDRGSGERKKRGERKNRGPASSSSFSLHIFSLSLTPFLLLSLKGRTWWPVPCHVEPPASPPCLLPEIPLCLFLFFFFLFCSRSI